jgi:hypothetical protein
MCRQKRGRLYKNKVGTFEVKESTQKPAWGNLIN